MTPRTFILDDPKRVPNFSAWLAKQPLPLDVLVKPYKKKRSNQANRRLRALHKKAGDVTGCSGEEMHVDCLCDYFGYTEHKMPSGYIRRKPIRTTTTDENGERDVLKGDEFTKFMTWVEQRYIDMLGVWLGQGEE